MVALSKNQAKKKFGERLKNLKKEKRQSYRAMAKGTGLSSSFISDVTNGSYFPSIDSVIRLSDFLGVNEEYLLSGFEYWIKPKGLHFEDVELTKENLSIYYSFLAKEKELYDNEKAIKVSHKDKTHRAELQLPRKNMIHDNSLDMLGIKKDAVLGSVPLDDLSEIESNMIYRIELDKGIYYRRVFKDESKLILIPYNNDNRFDIMSVKLEDIKYIEKVVTVEYMTSGKITKK